MPFFLEFLFCLHILTLSFFLSTSASSFFLGAPTPVRCTLALHFSLDNRQLLRVVVIFLNDGIFFFDLILYNPTILDDALFIYSVYLLYDMLFAYNIRPSLYRDFLDESIFLNHADIFFDPARVFI